MINETLRLLRVFHDYKSSELAKLLGISPGYLSEIENAKKKPTLALIEKYSKILEMPQSSIMFFAENYEKKNLKNKMRDTISKSIIYFLQNIEKSGNK